MAGADLNSLPESIICAVLSFTTPRDACMSSLTSWIFRLATESDVLWEAFLPFFYWKILSRSVSPVAFQSKKELYFRLCSGILIDGGSKYFSLEKPTGKTRYMLSPIELNIFWGSDNRYWSWQSLPDSRFSEVAVLLRVFWLEIHGKIYSHMLSPNTTYAAYLILKFNDHVYGLNSHKPEFSVEFGNQFSTRTAYLHGEDIEQLGHVRDDGWMEIEFGEFITNEGDDVEGKVILKGTKGIWKSGLIVGGIEVKPRA